jgi:hypothetical protein
VDSRRYGEIDIRVSGGRPGPWSALTYTHGKPRCACLCVVAPGMASDGARPPEYVRRNLGGVLCTAREMFRHARDSTGRCPAWGEVKLRPCSPGFSPADWVTLLGAQLVLSAA